jgi:hypothetical protein
MAPDSDRGRRGGGPGGFLARLDTRMRTAGPWSCGGQVAAYADSAPAAQLATVNMRRRDAAIPPV